MRYQNPLHILRTRNWKVPRYKTELFFITGVTPMTGSLTACTTSHCTPGRLQRIDQDTILAESSNFSVIWVFCCEGFAKDLWSQFSHGAPLADHQAALIILPLLWAHVWVRDFKMLGNFAFLSIAVTFYMEIAVMVQVCK